MVAEGLPAQVACRVIEVSESGFYAWRSRAPSARAIRHAWLTDLIAQVHVDFRAVYGYRRVHAELTLGHGLTVGAEAACKGSVAGPSTGGSRTSRPPVISSTGTSPAANRIDCGSRTSPSTPHGRARSTALSSSTPTPGESSAGPSTPARTRRSSPTPSGWRSPSATPPPR
jgi:hypothetical protein